MKKILLCSSLLLVNFLAPGQGLVESKILDLSKKKFDWLIGNQYDSLDKYLDEKIQYIHSNGWVQSKIEILDDMKTRKLVYQKVTIKESSVRVYDQAAVVTGLGIFEGLNGGNPFSIELRYTEVFVKAGNQWKLASRHSNRMP